VETASFDDLHVPRLGYPMRDVRSNDVRRLRMHVRTTLEIAEQTTIHESAQVRIKTI